MKALMCCSNTRPYLEVHPFDLSNSFFRLTDDSFHALNGKIVAECDIEVEEIKKVNYDCILFTNTLDTEDLINKSGIDYFSLEEYLKPNWSKEDDLQNLDTVGYAIHIKNIQFIEEPYNVNEVWQYKKYNVHLKNTPKNMCRVYGKDGEPYVLITASSEELCRCLNKKQSVLVRKDIAKVILEEVGE